MKRLFCLALSVASTLWAVEAQFSTLFQRRFGPDSFIYNEPLYFSSQRLIKKEQPVKTHNYRHKIKKTIEKSRRSRKARPEIK